jgi:hypothetical protein
MHPAHCTARPTEEQGNVQYVKLKIQSLTSGQVEGRPYVTPPYPALLFVFPFRSVVSWAVSSRSWIIAQ